MCAHLPLGVIFGHLDSITEARLLRIARDRLDPLGARIVRALREEEVRDHLHPMEVQVGVVEARVPAGEVLHAGDVVRCRA